ncbi:beta-lactamase family protein [Ophiocordyceps camponoti-floridani]|uniref:Beta-lactamase family protein n=1 Tax=Ophiocordyceps camponoti-floridani TaxID=2030778 RepID=A0A8H4VD20_9HYPO|nr:beta-lactamase family protein [Ophiocordyceps camponoti-floridani]
MDIVRSPDFAAYVTRLMRLCHVPGLAVAVAQGDEVVSAGFGKASLDPEVECTADTLFDMASASKSLTAASVALLIADEGHPDVQWKARMEDLLPGDFIMPGSDHSHVTVEDILSHRTGMPSHDNSYLGCEADNPDDARSITRNLRNLAVVAPNRSSYMYCNMMYTVASYLVERVSGLSFGDYLEERLLQPLGMNDTSLQPVRARAKGLGDRIAKGYVWNEHAAKYEETPCNDDAPEAQGAGCVQSSVNDYIKWVQAMMNRSGPISEDVYQGLVEKRIRQSDDDVPEDVVWEAEAEAEAQGDAPSDKPPPLYYAVGWEVREYCQHTIVSHSGSEDGFRSNHFFVPELNFGGVIVGNSGGAADVVSEVTHRLIDEVVKGPDAGRGLLDSSSDSGSESGSSTGSDDDNELGPGAQLRQQLCPGIKEAQPQTMPLSAYTGRYWNEGYREMVVEERDGELAVDAMKRSMGFHLRLEHVSDQTKYLAYLRERFDREGQPLKAEFRLQGDRAVRMGLWLEEQMKDYVWFERIDD